MIIYLHGFNSSPASHKARTLIAEMAARGIGDRIVCPTIPHRPADAVALVEDLYRIHAARGVTFVGSSLGGFYATWFAERHGRRAVLINPALRPYDGLEAFLGPQQNLYTGERYALTREHLAGWRALVPTGIDPERYLLLLETGDELLDWRESARRYEGARMVIRDGGDHTLQSFPEHIARVLGFAGLAST